MSDGKNEARVIRVLEIASDYRSLRTYCNSLLSRADAAPPDVPSASLPGYMVMRQLQAQLANLDVSDPPPIVDPGRGGNNGDEETRKIQLQRIVLDFSARRFVANGIYLRAAAAIRWVQARQQVLRTMPENRRAEALRVVDQRLRDELASVTDQYVYSNLRTADSRKGVWMAEDPSLDRVLAWLRR